MLSSDVSLDMDEIAKDLEEIELKFTPKANRKCPKISIFLHKNLTVLSKEFDCLGLPNINVEKPISEVLEQVVNVSRDLVQIHRNAVNHIKDKNVETVTQDSKHKDLYDKLDNYKASLQKLHDSCIALKNSKLALKDEIKELKKRELTYKEELKQLKRINSSREQLLEHNIQKLQLEIDRLKEICHKEIVSKTPMNEVALQLLKKYKISEEIYKSTINTLQGNNRELLDDILSLKEEIILLKSKQ